MNDGIKPENPDLLPATRGYVKCIARKIHNHKHEQNGRGIATYLAATIGVGLWFVMLISTPRTPEWAYWIVVAFDVITICISYDRQMDFYTSTGTPDPNQKYDVINAWAPKKNNCCEPEEDGSYSRY
jgi:hypothetical protein